MKAYFDYVRIFQRDLNISSKLPGVKAEDWAKYDLTVEYTANDPNPLMSAPPAILKFRVLKNLDFLIVPITRLNIPEYLLLQQRDLPLCLKSFTLE
jgi:hypothetical protein